jgi:hypothetical protein
MPPFLWTQKQDIGPSSRAHHAMTYDPVRQRVVLFGGDTGGPALADTWQWDGALWTQVADTGPSARHSSALTYDPARQTLVLFGGVGPGDRFGDTWVRYGEAWTQIADTGPSPRGGHAMTYDSGRERVVLFGGYGDAGPLRDTWEWDGNEWTQVEDTGPSARRGHAVAFDAFAARTVLFGGAGVDHASLNDTWTWDGAVWTQVADTGPEPRSGAAMVAAEKIVLFGGVNSNDPALAPEDRVIYGDSWRWDGATWTRVQDMGPAPRWGHAMTYRNDALRIVLFGGATVFAPPGDAALQPGLARDTWEHSEAVPGGGQPDGGQPDGGGPDTGGIEVASVTLDTDTVANEGDVLNVTVTLTEPSSGATALIIGIFYDTGGGNFEPSQPPGFTLPPQPIMVDAGAAQTQFQIVRDSDPIPPGTYGIGVGVDGGQGMQGAFFTVA